MNCVVPSIHSLPSSPFNNAVSTMFGNDYHIVNCARHPRNSEKSTANCDNGFYRASGAAIIATLLTVGRSHSVDTCDVSSQSVYKFSDVVFA